MGERRKKGRMLMTGRGREGVQYDEGWRVEEVSRRCSDGQLRLTEEREKAMNA